MAADNLYEELLADWLATAPALVKMTSENRVCKSPVLSTNTLVCESVEEKTSSAVVIVLVDL